MILKDLDVIVTYEDLKRSLYASISLSQSILRKLGQQLGLVKNSLSSIIMKKLPLHPWLLNNDLVYRGAYEALSYHFRTLLIYKNSKGLPSGEEMQRNAMLLTYRHLYNHLREKYG